jgi:hypothetical protein
MVATPAAQTASKVNAAIEAAEVDGSDSTTVAQTVTNGSSCDVEGSTEGQECSELLRNCKLLK